MFGYCIFAGARDSRGGISGRVIDRPGAVIPGAPVVTDAGPAEVRFAHDAPESHCNGCACDASSGPPCDPARSGYLPEITGELRKKGAQIDLLRYDAEAMKLVLDEMCRKAGVKTLLHARVVAAQKDGARLTTVITESSSGRHEHHLGTVHLCPEVRHSAFGFAFPCGMPTGHTHFQDHLTLENLGVYNPQ